MNLKNIVSELILSKREGDYWDFKETSYDSQVDLLHDILCMAKDALKRMAGTQIGSINPIFLSKAKQMFDYWKMNVNV